MNAPDLFNRRGYAIIIVLFGIVLCALMIVILMERGTMSLKSTSAYSDGIRVRALSEMVQNLVQAQIHEATTLNQKTGTPLKERSTWASQPGAIRVYSPVGELQQIYKLYSATALATDDPELAQDVPGDWHERLTEYTDLNEPVLDATTSHYPILNPALATSSTAAALLPGATGIAGGFSITSAPVAEAGANAAPMPVRWIYVLQDGTLCQLDDSRIDRKTNPIVGRIAFWTDDETAKVNINTAAPVTQSSYWDIPRTRSTQEINSFAWGQPAQNEYQRYPGHPATVSLRSILGHLGNMASADYYALTPRYYWGGSQDGAKLINVPRDSLLTLKEDRTYSSVDELLFKSRATGNPATPLRGNPTEDQVSALHFFLSASSRAPELNLFGQPRISIWPIHAQDSETRRTPYDRLIAHNSTLGGKKYYFQRENPLSPTDDYANIARNQELYAYLQELTKTPVPGFPGEETFLSKYANERDQILTQIFDYIRIANLNETYQGRASGFQSYTSSWKIDSNPQIETALNTTISYPANGGLRGAGLVVPIEIGTTRGMGRFPVIAEVGLMFVTHSEKKPGGTVPNAPHVNNKEQLEGMLVIETVTPAFGYMPWIGKDLVFEVVNSDLKFRVGDRVQDFLPAAAIGDHNTNPIHYPPLIRGGSTPGGYDGASYVAGPDATSISGNNFLGQPIYRFFSAPLDLVKSSPPSPGDDTEFSIEGGTIELNIRVGGVVVQTYKLVFPSIPTLQLPVRNAADYELGYLTTGIPYGRPWWGVRHRDGHAGSFSLFGPFDQDILHSIELVHGDARIAMGRKDVPSAFFVPHADYGKPQRFAHGMRTTDTDLIGRLWNGGSAGTFVSLALSPNATPVGLPAFYSGLRTTVHPKVPSTITNLTDSWSGDFDNAFGRFVDGPFINKPDEGMMDTSAGFATSAPPYNSWRWSVANGLFSPLRQIPSAVMFGSLPTGVKANEPWRTLLFNPNPSTAAHIGFDDPADHLLLDLFRMPVVEPYAISSPAATDGKINLNYAIAPFSYIRRASSWYALLEPMRLFAIPDSKSTTYKGAPTTPADTSVYRSSVNIPETLAQFETRFAANDLFRSASEICSLFLVPSGSTLTDVSNLAAGYWSKHRLTGDNSRERPYAELYPKLTTQSNTYRLHLRVQTLPPSDKAPTGRDFKPLSEYRGSRLIERYLNAGDPAFQTVDPDTSNLNELYRYRVLEARQFTP